MCATWLDRLCAATVKTASLLQGRLVLSQSGWLVLEVPNSLGKGAFQALNAPGVELPTDAGKYQAHITVMTDKEIEQIGGANKITERGQTFHYEPGKTRDFNPIGWAEMNRCWVIECAAPELSKLRKSYGLSALPYGNHRFHITFGVRQSGVLGENDKSKAVVTDNRKVREKHLPWDVSGTHLVKVSVSSLFKEQNNGHDRVRTGGRSGSPSVPLCRQGQAVPDGAVDPAGPGKSAACDDGDRAPGADIRLRVDGGRESKSAAENDVHPPDDRGSVGNSTATGAGATIEKRAFVDEIMRTVSESKPVREWMKSQGLTPGPWRPEGSLQDYLEEQQFADTKTQLIQQAASSDPAPKKILRGLVTATGGEWTDEMDAQAADLQQGYAAAAPHIMRWAPNWWDKLHGGTGSVASLASAIADAHRYEEMSPEKAVKRAERVFTEMVDDPQKMRGLSARQLGDTYKYAVSKGHVHRGMSGGKVVDALVPIVGTVSAVRDSMGPAGGDPNDMDAVFESVERIASMHPNQTWGFRESQVRMGKYRGQQGGTMAAAMRMSGQSITPGPGVAGIDELEAQNAQLMQAAGGSDVMRMVAATARARADGLIGPSSSAARFLEKAQSGQELPYISGSQWAQMMQSSGPLTAQSAMVVLSQDAHNEAYITPEMQTAVRMAQSKYDHQPQLAQLSRQAQQPWMRRMKPGARQSIMEGEKSKLVRRGGYNNWKHYNQLHGPGAENLGNVLRDSRDYARVSKRNSPYGWQGPVERVVDTLKGPETATGQSLAASALGAIRTPTSFKTFKPPRPFKSAAIRGLPDKQNFGDLSQLKPEQVIDLVIQRHKARRAGEHFDYRIGRPDTGLFSWSMKPTRLPKPGEKRFVRQQPVHSHQYGSFQGTIGKGYGKGEVRREQKGKVLVTNAEPEKIEFTVASSGTPERFVLLKPKTWGAREWLLINNTPNKPVPYDKTHYKSIPAEEVEPYIQQMQEGTSVQAKLDGAASLVKLMRNGAEILSYRVSKKTGRPIFHTEKVFGTRPKFEVPKDLVGTVLKGELYGHRHAGRDDAGGAAGPITGGDAGGNRVDGAEVREGGVSAGRPIPPANAAGPGGVQGDSNGQAGDADVRNTEGAAVPRDRTGGAGTAGARGQVVPPQELGGLLNSTIEHSLAKQKEKGISIKNMLFDIRQRGKEQIDPNVTPYAERRQMIQDIMQHLPQDTFSLSEEATTPESAQQLWESITGKTHPLTHEGVVIHPPTGKPIKAKPMEESDVSITDIFPGAGRLQGTAAGGFGYSLEPGGERVGEVGTGLTDELRRQLWQDRDAYVGRTARVRSQEQFPSGALRAPALLALHEDRPTRQEFENR